MPTSAMLPARMVVNADYDTLIPYHPGAMRYYREIGVALPAGLVSTR